MKLNPEAKSSFEKALSKLREAENIDAKIAPGAVVHSSYYAMFHAAVAYIYWKTGAAPTKHDQ